MGSNTVSYSSIIDKDPISSPALWIQTQAARMRYDAETDLILTNGSVTGNFATFDIPGDSYGQLNNIMPYIDSSGNNDILNGFSLFTPGELTAQGILVSYTFGIKSSTRVYLVCFDTKILYSYDGIIWTPSNIPETTVRGFASNNSIILALGDMPTPILYSTNGITWQTSSSAQLLFNTDGCITSAAWNGSFWIAVGYSSSSTICVKSVDGIHWTNFGNLTQLISYRIICITYSHSLWVAGGSGTNSMAYSNDGENWFSSSSASIFINAGSATSLLFSNNKWFLGIRDGNGTSSLCVSQDGKEWLSSSSALSVLSKVNAIATNGSILVAVGSSVAYSIDNGVSWISTIVSNLLPGQTFLSILWNGSVFKVGSSSGKSVISPNGIQWSLTSAIPFADGKPISGFAFFNNTFESLPSLNIQSTTPITLTTNNTLYIKFGKTAMDSSLITYLQYVDSLSVKGMIPNTLPGKQNESFLNKLLLPANILQGQTFTVGTTSITPTLVGIYNSNTSYRLGDLVYYPDASGSLVMCLIGHDIRGNSYSYIRGIEPVETPFTSPYWNILVYNGWDTWTYNSSSDLALNVVNISTNYVFSDSNFGVVSSNIFPANFTLQLPSTTLQGYSLFGSGINQLTRISSFGYSFSSNLSAVYAITLNKSPAFSSNPLYVKNGLSNFLSMNTYAFNNYISLFVNSAALLLNTIPTQSTLIDVTSNLSTLNFVSDSLSSVMAQYPTQPIPPIAYEVTKQLKISGNGYSLGLQIYENDISLGNTPRISQSRSNLLNITSTITSIYSKSVTTTSFLSSGDVPNSSSLLSTITAYTQSINIQNSYYNNIITPTDIGYSIINSNNYMGVFPSSLMALNLTNDFTIEWVTVNCLSNSDFNLRSSLFGEFGSMNFFSSNEFLQHPLFSSNVFSITNLSNPSSIPPYFNYSIGLNQQNHFAWVRNGSNLNYYINGYSVYNTTSPITFIQGSNFILGANQSINTIPRWKGGLRNFRLDTSAIYKTNFNTTSTITSLTTSVFTSNLSPLSTSLICLPLNQAIVFNDFSPLHNFVSSIGSSTSSVALTYSTMITPFTQIPSESGYMLIPRFPTSVSMTVWAYPQTSVTVTWASSLYATSYTVSFFYTTTNTTSGGTLLQTITSTGTSASSTTAIANGLYLYAVVNANNSVGSSIQITTPTTTYVDQPPTNVQMSPWVNGHTTMTVTWTAAPIATSYVVAFYTNSTNSTSNGTLLQTFTNVLTTTQSTNLTLAYGTYYYATVYSLTNVGYSTTTISSNALQFLPLPLNPSGLTMTPILPNTNTITISWSPSMYSHSYSISFFSNPTNTTSGGTLVQTFTNIEDTTVTTSVTLTVAGFYYATVTGVNPTGTSSAILSSTVYYTPACGPVSIVAMNPYINAATTISLSWTAAAYATTYNIIFYSNTVNSNSGGTIFQTFNSVSNTATSLSTTATLSQETYYYASIQAINSNKNSAIVFSQPIYVIQLPSPPTTVSMAVWTAGITVVSVSWSSASRAASYTVEFYSNPTNTTTGGTLFQTITTTSTTSSTTNALTQGRYYFAKVTSVNSTGPSTSITSSNTAFYNPFLQAPSSISLTISSLTISSSWDSSPDLYGTPTYTLSYYTNTTGLFSGGTLVSTISGISSLTNTITFSNISYRNYYYATVFGIISGLSSFSTITTTKQIFIPATFSPTYINNLTYWFDAADNTSLTIDNSSVISWANKGTLGGSATLFGTFPVSTLNSLNTIQFNSQQYMRIPSYTGAAMGTSMFVVMKATSNLSNSTGYYPIFNSGGPNIQITASGTNVYYNQDTGSALYANLNTTNLSTFTENTVILSSVENGTTSLPAGVWNNGSNIPFSSGTGSSLTTFSSPTLGTSNSTGMPFQLAEIIIYTSNLPYTHRQAIEGYLAWKWSLQTSLPFNHPFKTLSSESFSPLTLPGLQLWVDATDPSASGQDLADTTNLTAWNDKSGNSRNITLSTTGSGTITSLAKAINNLSVVYFNSPASASVKGYASIPSGTFSRNYTTFSVYKIKSFTSQQSNLTILSRGQSLYEQFGETRYIANQLISDSSINSNNWIVTSNLNVNILTTNINYPNGSNIVFSENLNGSPLSFSTTIPSTTSVNDSNSYINLTNKSSLATWAQIDIQYCEILVFNVPFTTLQQQQMEAYLAVKWGINSSLPSTNPFKLANTLIIPSQFPGNQIWLDASDPLGNATNTENSISTWYDKSGFSRNLSLSNTNIGSVNEAGTIRSSNTIIGQGMVVPLSTSGISYVPPNTFINSLSFFAVYKSLTNLNGAEGLLHRGTFSTPSVGPLPFYSSNSLSLTGDDGATQAYTVTSLYQSNVAILYLSINQLSNTISYGLNGSVSNVASITPWTPTDTKSYLNFFDRDIGNNSYGGLQFNGIVYEILVFNRAFTTEQRMVMEGYLASKWSLRSVLPVLHPFRILSPILAPTYDFTPECIPNLRLWLDGNDPLASGITPPRGFLVNTWYDKSDSMNHAISSNYPTMSSNGISFNGSNQCFVTPYPAFSSAETGFLVLRMNASTSQPLLTGASSNTSRQLWGQVGSRWAFGLTSSANSYYSFSTINSTNTTYLISYSYNNSILNGYENGNFMGSNTTNIPNFLGIGTGLSNPTIIGSSIPFNSVLGSVNWFNGTMSEIVVFNSVLSTTERQQVEGYLVWKWGINANLSSNHQYYYVPPRNTILTNSRSLLAPQNLSLQSVTGNTISIQWTPSSNIEYYQFILNGSSVIPSFQTLSNASFSALTPTTSYTIQIIAKNSYGSASTSITASTLSNFNPASIGGMQAWYDANDIMGNNTTLANGTAISTWYDKSGNSRNAVNSNGYGIFSQNVSSYLPGLYFTGSNYYSTSIPIGTFSSNYSYFIVYRNTVSVTGKKNTLVNRVISGQSYGNPISLMSNTVYITGSNTVGGAGNSTNTSYNLYNTTLSLLSVHLSQSLNPSNIVFSEYTNGSIVPFTGSLAISSPYGDGGNLFVIGSDGSFGSISAFNGYIHEVIVYNNQLSGTQRQTIEGYLAWKWGLQSQLPPFHTYSSISPNSYTNLAILPLPYTIAGLQLWLDATDPFGTGVAPVNGFSLNFIKDKSENSYTTRFFTRNSLYQVNFSGLALTSNPSGIYTSGTYPYITPSTQVGTAIYSTIPSNTFLGAMSVFIVYNTYSSSYSVPLFTRTIAPAQAQQGNAGNCVDNQGTSFNIGLNGAATFNTGFSFNNSSRSIQNVNINQTAGSLSLLSNGVSRYNGTVAFTPSDIGNIFSIFGRGDLGTNFLPANLNEVLVFNSFITASQRQRIEGYLAWKWGLVSQLPLTHPFYTVAPTEFVSLEINSYTQTTITLSWNGALGAVSYLYTVNGISTIPISEDMNNKTATFGSLSVYPSTYVFVVTAVFPSSSSSLTVTSLPLQTQYNALPTAAIYLNAVTYNGTSTTWLDSSPNNVNASLYRGTAAKNTSGNGVLFNGSTAWSFPEINLGNTWTICMWLRNITALNGACVLTQPLGASSSVSVCDGDYGNNLHVWFYSNPPGRVFSPGAAFKTLSVTINTWTYIQATWDGTNLITYFNGIQFGPVQTSTAVSKKCNDVYYIGRRFNGDAFMNGEVGEVRIFRTALTPAQIYLLYNYTVSSYPN